MHSTYHHQIEVIGGQYRGAPSGTDICQGGATEYVHAGTGLAQALQPVAHYPAT